MPRRDDVLYPVNYTETKEVQVDGDANGRNRDRLVQLARDLVPEGGEPKTWEEFRDAVKGKEADARCRSFTFSEMRRVWAQVINERKDTWDFGNKAKVEEIGSGQGTSK